jgi:excisionase family DNA binding protein
MGSISEDVSGMGGHEFYTVKQLASLLQITQMTVYRMVRRGELTCHSIGRAMRFRRNDIEGFLERCRVNGSSEPAEQGN